MPTTKQSEFSQSASIQIETANSVAIVKISGDWLIANKRQSIDIESQIQDSTNEIKFDCAKLGKSDSSLICLLLKVYDIASTRKILIDRATIPESARDLFNLATAVNIKSDDSKNFQSKNIFHEVGTHTITTLEKTKEQLVFLGEFTVAFLNMFRFRTRFMFADLMTAIQRSGPNALLIVSIISFLVGLILAFVGAIQLSKFGSTIYIADLVGLAMVREMGAIMVAIVMAGRTGAAFAAELGSMKVNEEIAAYKTFGISPMDFLVLPRMIALVLMFPLLTVFADLMGILGGFTIAWGMFDINYQSYFVHTANFLNLTQCFAGLGKSVIFGIIVAMIGCMKGMTCGDSAEDVGLATTSSVVTSITLIVIADAIFAVLFNIFGI